MQNNVAEYLERGAAIIDRVNRDTFADVERCVSLLIERRERTAAPIVARAP
jgi:hypothetical protein